MQVEPSGYVLCGRCQTSFFGAEGVAVSASNLSGGRDVDVVCSDDCRVEVEREQRADNARYALGAGWNPEDLRVDDVDDANDIGLRMWLVWNADGDAAMGWIMSATPFQIRDTVAMILQRQGRQS